MKKAIIVDLDNCLFDSRELIRKHFPTDEKSREQWDIYHSHYDICEPVRWCVELVKRFATDYTVLFITSREARGSAIRDTLNCIEKTFKNYNLGRQDGNYVLTMNAGAITATPSESYLKDFHLIMRTEEDYRSSVEVKRDLYMSFVKDRYDVFFAIDDEQGNIDLWKNLGISTLKCDFGDKN